MTGQPWSLEDLAAHALASDWVHVEPRSTADRTEVLFQRYLLFQFGPDALHLGSEGADAFVGTWRRDLMLAGPGDDLALAGPGDDVVLGGDGADRLYGDAGNDQIYGGSGDDVLHGGSGRGDFLAGGPGDDVVDLRFSTRRPDDARVGDSFAAYKANKLNGQGAAFGGEGDDWVFGSFGRDMLVGGSGDDRLTGLDGDDWLLGDEDEDALYGGGGADRLEGGEGEDRLEGGLGNDGLHGEEGRDVLYGGNGLDVIIGDDIYRPRAAGSADALYGGYGGDYVYALGGDDRVDPGGGGDRVWLGRGNDVAFGLDDFGRGDDEIHGEEGDDRLHGGRGDDRLHGGIGDDAFFGGAGDDALSGGDGADVFVFYGASGVDTIVDLDALDAVRIKDDPNGTSVDRVRSFTLSFAGDVGTIELGGGHLVRIEGLTEVAFAQIVDHQTTLF